MLDDLGRLKHVAEQPAQRKDIQERRCPDGELWCHGPMLPCGRWADLMCTELLRAVGGVAPEVWPLSEEARPMSLQDSGCSECAMVDFTY